MTLGDGLVGLGFVACFGLIFFWAWRGWQLNVYLRERYIETWTELHRGYPRGVIFVARFYLFFGWRKLGPDPIVRAYLRDMLVAYMSSMICVVVIVALGASLPLKVFRYVPAEHGVGGSVVLDSDDR